MPRYESQTSTPRGTTSYRTVATSTLVAFAVAFVIAFVLSSMTGCKNPNRAGRYKAPASTSMSSNPSPSSPKKSTATTPRENTPPSAKPASGSSGNRVQLVDAEIAGEMKLRSAWQQRIPSAGSGGIKKILTAGGDIVVIDQRNAMTVIEAQSGKELWHEAPVPPREVIFGIDRFYLDDEDLLLVTTDTDLYIVGADTGLQITRQNLAQIPSTEVLKVGDEIVYGTARGRLVWHNITVGYELKANGMGSGVAGAPVQIGNRAGATSVEGKIGVFDSNNARRIWTRQLNAGFKFGPAMTQKAIYGADEGQRITCFDIDSGQVMWKYFSDTALTDGPQVFDDRVIQQVGVGGTLCLEALPANSPQGKMIWHNTSLFGEIVTVLGDDLVLWDAKNHVLSRIDSENGSIKKSIALPNVDRVQVARDETNGDRMLLVFNLDGRVQRLDPRR